MYSDTGPSSYRWFANIFSHFYRLSFPCGPIYWGMVFRDSVWVLEALGCLSSRNQPKDPLRASAALGSRASSHSDAETQRREAARPWAPAAVRLCGTSQGPGLVSTASLGVFIPAQSTCSKPPDSTVRFTWVPPAVLLLSVPLLQGKPFLGALAQRGPPGVSSFQEAGSCTWTCDCCSVAQSCPTLWTPWTAHQASLSFTFYLLEFVQTRPLSW